mgnify:CR=1 FL=1
MTHLTEEQLEFLKSELVKERNSILSELMDEESILSRKSSDYVEDSGELAFDNLDKHIISKLSVQQKKTLKKIEKALSKIDDGSYGICEKSGNPISYQRLEILPYTTVCKEYKV